MDKLRILPQVFVCVLFATPTLAQLEPITPGTVTVFDVSMVFHPGGPDDLFFPKLTQTAFTPGGGGHDDSRFFLPVSNCPNPFGAGCSTIGGGQFSATDITFHTPMNSVEALGMTSGVNEGTLFAATLLAFDGTTIVASCSGPHPPFGAHSAPAGCFSVTSSTTAFDGEVVYTGNLAVSAPAITSVWVFGSGDLGSSAEQIRAVPEPRTWALLAFALAGLAVARCRATSQSRWLTASGR